MRYSAKTSPLVYTLARRDSTFLKLCESIFWISLFWGQFEGFTDLSQSFNLIKNLIIIKIKN